MRGLCPRCGSPVSYYERQRKGGRTYVVAVHYMGYERGPGGRVRKRVRKCYLGPLGGYEYVSRLHSREGLVLKGLSEPWRAVDYLEALAAYISEAELGGEEALRLAETLEAIAKALRIRAGGRS